MIRALYIFAAALMFSTSAKAIEINNLQAGTLGNTGLEATETSLTISGEMNAADFHYILDNLPNLQSLNISAVTITPYSGPALPYTGLTSSPANTLPDYALTGMSKLTSIVLPRSLKAIGKGSLSGAGLVTLEIPDGVESVGDYAAMRCESLKELKIGGISSLGTRAFANCPQLTTVEMSAAVDSLPEGLFEACGGLKSIDLSALADCKNIGPWAFAECNGMETLVLPPATVELATGSLYATTKLAILELPSEISMIDDHAMGSMSGLATLMVNTVERVPELGSNVWANIDQSKVNLITPNEQVDEYRSSEQWKEFNIISEEEWQSSIEETVTPSAPETSMHVTYTDGSINISSKGQPLGKVAIFNGAGVRMITLEAKQNVSVNVNGWPKGVYLVVSNLGAAKTVI